MVWKLWTVESRMVGAGAGGYDTEIRGWWKTMKKSTWTGPTNLEEREQERGVRRA